MSVSFDNNAFFKTVQESDILIDQCGIFNYVNVNSLFSYVKENKQFSYGDTTYEEFSRLYSTDGWIGRKVMAIPQAILCGVVKTVYHLAQALLLGIPKLYAGDFNYIKYKAFFLIRDFQEAFGWLTSLLDDKYGLFHIQGSQFHKTCYHCFSESANYAYAGSDNSLWQSGHSFTGKYGEMVDSGAQQTSLLDFQLMSHLEKITLMKRILLFDVVISLKKNHGFNFEEFLQETDETILQKLTLEDLLVDFDISILKFLVLNDDEFLSLSFGNLAGDNALSKPQKKFCAQRLRQLSETLQPTDSVDHEVDTSDWDTITLHQMLLLQDRQIAQQIGDIPPGILELLSNEQLSSVTLSSLTQQQCRSIFAGMDEDEIQERITLFDDQDVINAIHSGIFEGKAIKFLSNEILNLLDLNLLTAEQINHAFRKKPEQFARFTPEQVNLALKDSKFDFSWAPLLSDEQLAAVPLSELSTGTFDRMFAYNIDLDEKRERFSHFTHEQVNLALKDSKFDFNWALLLSDEQLAAVPLSELSTGTFNRMFAYNIDLDEKRERFSHFTHEQVNLALKDSKFDFSRANSNKCYCVLSRSLEA